MSPASSNGDERQDQTLSPLEQWKGQLAYVSGTILAWGTVLLQLWPVLARLQTGAHVHAWGRDEGVSVPATSYYLLALLVAVGLGMLIFGSAHVIARGFWLARFVMADPTPAKSPASDRIARSTYLVLHVFWATSLLFLLVVPLSAITSFLAALFTSAFGWNIAIARAVASALVFGSPLVAGIFLYRRHGSRGRSRLRGVVRRIGARHLILAYVSLPLLWLLVIEFSYVADVRLERHTFDRARDPSIVVSVELGGAVSNPAPARVALTRNSPNGLVSESLPLLQIDDGLHVAIVPTRALPSGHYQVAMTYPHAALSPVFPFYRNRINRTVGFVLVN